MKLRVLVVDDEQAILDSVAAVLVGGNKNPTAAARMQQLGRELFGAPIEEQLPEIDLVTCTQAEDAVAIVQQSIEDQDPFAVAFIDVRMPPGPDGVWAVQQIRAQDPDVEFVIMTAYTDIAPQTISRLAPPAGKLLYMQKPFHSNELRQLVASLSEKWTAQRQLKQSHQELEKRVRERTSELARANQLLQSEIEQRITKQRELERSEQNLKTILNSVPVSIAIVGKDKRIRRVNKEALTLMGRADDQDIVGMLCTDTICAEDSELCPLKNNDSKLENHECVMISANGNEIPILKNAVFATLDNEEVLIEAIVDLTERKKWEQALNESEARYRQLVEHAPAGIWEFDFSKGRFVSVNDVMLEYTGYSREEFLEMDPTKLLTEESFSEYLKRQQKLVAGEKVPETCEYQIQTKDGRNIWVMLNSNFFHAPDGTIVARAIAHNITRRKQDELERKMMESRVRQAQKMEALGSLAGGVAHDFNNILNSVIGFTELALREMPQDSDVRTYLKHVLQAGKRAGGLVRQILTFSRGGEPENKPIQMVTIVKEVLKLLRASLPATVDIQPKISNKPVMIMADPSQIHQVLMNLCTNAAQAMGDNGGVLEVVLEKKVVEKPLGLTLDELKPGEYLVLTVKDNGPGIPAANLARVFEPYFTTKEAMGGTGLGLAVVHGIVGSLGGAVDVSSVMGKGSVFHVYLPIPELTVTEIDEIEQSIPTGCEFILLVEDEPSLIELGQGILESLGYCVESASDGTIALTMIDNDPDKYDLLLTDQTMPKMTGLELAIQARKIRPDLPVILCTGYSEHISSVDLRRSGVDQLITKPMLMADLATAVRGALDRAQSEAC